MVHRKYLNCRTSDSRLSGDGCSFQPKVFDPGVGSWMKETHNLARRGIEAGNVRPFMAIAMKTRQGQAAGAGCPAVLPGRNVIHLKRKAIVQRRNAAIFASAVRPKPDLAKQVPIHCR